MAPSRLHQHQRMPQARPIGQLRPIEQRCGQPYWACLCHRRGCGRREPRSCRPKRWRVRPPSTSYRAAGVRARPPAPRQGQRWRRVAASTLGEGQRPHPQVCAARAGGSATVTSPKTAHRTAPLTRRGRGRYTRRMALAATSSNSARRGAVGAQTATLSRSRKRRAVQPPPATGSLSVHRACSRRPLAGRATLHSSCASNGRPPGMITRT